LGKLHRRFRAASMPCKSEPADDSAISNISNYGLVTEGSNEDKEPEGAIELGTYIVLVATQLHAAMGRTARVFRSAGRK
jgi:hypothetical protein